MSGYVINTFPGLLPGVVFVSGFSTHLYVVPLGKPFVFILPSALGSLPCFAVCPGCFAVGVNVSLCFLTVIGTSTSSTVPSGYVTNATVGWLPGVLTSGFVFHVTLVPLGRSVLSTLSSAFGTVPLSTVCGFGCGLYFPRIDETVIFTNFEVEFPALSLAIIVTPYIILSDSIFGTSCTPSLKTILPVDLSKVKNEGILFTSIVAIPLPFALSSASIFITGKVLSNAVISQFVFSAGVWIVGFVTSFTFNGIVTSCSEPSIYVTLAWIVWSPYVVVLTGDFDSTFEIFALPFSPCSLVALTAPFNISDVTFSFWFTSICVPVAVNSSLTFLTVTFTVTTSFDPSR